MFTKALDILRGLVLNPVLVAFARGVVEATVFFAVYLVGDAIAAGELADEVGQLGPFILLGLRTIEGVIDRIDPAKQRRRDALREEAVHAELSNGTAGPLNPGDVKDAEVAGQVESYQAIDYR